MAPGSRGKFHGLAGQSLGACDATAPDKSTWLAFRSWPGLDRPEYPICQGVRPRSFAPATWPQHAFSANAAFPGWWQFDLDALALADGVYEYELVANGTIVAADPYADAITRFGGYRGLFTISGGVRVSPSFSWDDEFPAGTTLPQNNQIVIYEMPVKWMSSDPSENPLVELGTFDKVIFEHLDDLVAMGINCIELLPIEDSPQTLNWGYGTRFFFAPDYDIGGPVDAKFFVKHCHQRGVRVVLDVVMNMYAPECPLTNLAQSWFNTASTPSRQDWGQELFLFDTPSYVSYYAAREFLCEMAEFWVTEYHIDGYRIDDFADINNWDFVQEFRDRASARSQSLFPAKPFWVIAEDSNRRFVTTGNDPNNPNGRKVVDAIWNFGYRDEIRRLLTNSLDTVFGQASRSDPSRASDFKSGRLERLAQAIRSRLCRHGLLGAIHHVARCCRRAPFDERSPRSDAAGRGFGRRPNR